MLRHILRLVQTRLVQIVPRARKLLSYRVRVSLYQSSLIPPVHFGSRDHVARFIAEPDRLGGHCHFEPGDVPAEWVEKFRACKDNFEWSQVLYLYERRN